MSARCHRFAGSIFLASGISHFSFFRLITTGTARWLFAWADGDEQPPGALERASSCTAARTGVAGLGTARCDRRGVAHRAALRPDLTWLLSCFKDRPDPGGQLVRFDRVRRRQHKPRWSDRPPRVAVSQTRVYGQAARSPASVLVTVAGVGMCHVPEIDLRHGPGLVLSVGTRLAIEPMRARRDAARVDP